MQEEGSTSTLHVTEAEGGQKLMQFLLRRLSLPQTMLHRWVRTGQIRHNGGRCKPFDHVQTGDTVRLPPFALSMHRSAAHGASSLSPQPPQENDAPGAPAPSGTPRPSDPPRSVGAPAPSVLSGHPGLSAPSGTSGPADASPAARHDDALSILHAGGYLLVLNKPAGLPVHPGTGHSDSIATRLAARHGGAPFRPTPAHRLDRDTSGLLLVASAYSVLRALQDAFRHRHMVKEYVAWVHGVWQGDEPVLLRHRLAKKYEGWDEKMRVLTTHHPEDAAADAGKEAVCVVRCLRRETGLPRPPDPYSGARSLVQVRLITGRTHQIRAQLAAVGHPLCGDVKYGAPEQRGQAPAAAQAPASSAASTFPAPARLASPLSAPRQPATGRSVPAPGARPVPPAPRQPAPMLYLHSLRIILPGGEGAEAVPELAHLPREFAVLPPWGGREALREMPPPLTVPEA